MKLEVGKWYWTRSGEVAFIGTDTGPFQWKYVGLLLGKRDILTWRENGRSGNGKDDWPNDLVAEVE